MFCTLYKIMSKKDCIKFQKKVLFPLKIEAISVILNKIPQNCNGFITVSSTNYFMVRFLE